MLLSHSVPRISGPDARLASISYREFVHTDHCVSASLSQIIMSSSRIFLLESWRLMIYLTKIAFFAWILISILFNLDSQLKRQKQMAIQNDQDLEGIKMAFHSLPTTHLSVTPFLPQALSLLLRRQQGVGFWGESSTIIHNILPPHALSWFYSRRICTSSILLGTPILSCEIWQRNAWARRREL